MVEYKLYYFNGRGRGEVIRFIFSLAGQKFQDVRIEQANWPEYKKKAPFGQAPFLEVVDGSKTLTLSQSLAIARFLARKFNLVGKGEEEQVQVDMYADQVTDFYAEFGKALWEKDEKKKAELTQKLYNETVPNQLRLFENKISKTKSGCLFDSGLTWADLYLFTTLEMLSDRPEVFNDYPSLKALGKVIRENPKIAAYLAARPKTNF